MELVAVISNMLPGLIRKAESFGLEHSLQVLLPLEVVLQPEVEEFPHDLCDVVVLLHAAVGIKQNHRASRERCLKLEELMQTFVISLAHLFL
jgi:hypothetical protein